jgi:hypothetical protein
MNRDEAAAGGNAWNGPAVDKLRLAVSLTIPSLARAKAQSCAMAAGANDRILFEKGKSLEDPGIF